MPDPQKSFWREFRRRASALDVLIGAYVLAFAIALAILGRNSPAWPALFVGHLLLFVSIVGIVWYWHDRTNGVPGFLRQLYPVILYSVFYSEMQVANFWVIPHFLDSQLVAFERGIVGVDLNVWLMRVQTTWANEIMMLGYFSYYLLIPSVALLLFFRRRHDDLRGMLLSTTTAFVLSYVGFVLLPVEGPRYFFADQFPHPLSGWLFVPLVRTVINQGAIHGGCMPSSHAAVALVILFWSRRAMPRLGSILTPFVLVLILGTVWGRFHYASDTVVGIIVGFVALAITGFWSRRAQRPSVRAVVKNDLINQNRRVES